MLERVTADLDVSAVARLVHHAFASPLDGAEKWLRDAGLEHLRVLRASSGSVPEACLLRIPMGQYFGGVAIPMLGIAGVAVSPEARGRGLARVMMGKAMQEAAREGFAISCLYASTLGLYRQVGYEQAGHRFITTLPIGRIDIRERGSALRSLSEADDPAIRACYGRFAPAFNGMLDRGPYCWRRVRDLRGTVHAGFGVEDGRGGLDGYVFLSQQREQSTGFHDLALTDLVFTTASAGRRLLGFLADFATMAEQVSFGGGPLHPIVSLLSLRQSVVEKKDYWMVRILDIKAAIETRMYPKAVSAELALDVADDLIPENNGRWRIRVKEGRAEATRGPSSPAGLSCDIRGLAPLYSGLYTARQLALLEWVRGDDHALAAADAIFGGGGTPWMLEGF
jgi:predicted acetyltransferase